MGAPAVSRLILLLLPFVRCLVEDLCSLEQYDDLIFEAAQATLISHEGYNNGSQYAGGLACEASSSYWVSNGDLGLCLSMSIDVRGIQGVTDLLLIECDGASELEIVGGYGLIQCCLYVSLRFDTARSSPGDLGWSISMAQINNSDLVADNTTSLIFKDDRTTPAPTTTTSSATPTTTSTSTLTTAIPTMVPMTTTAEEKTLFTATNARVAWSRDAIIAGSVLGFCLLVGIFLKFGPGKRLLNRKPGLSAATIRGLQLAGNSDHNKNWDLTSSFERSPTVTTYLPATARPSHDEGQWMMSRSFHTNAGAGVKYNPLYLSTASKADDVAGASSASKPNADHSDADDSDDDSTNSDDTVDGIADADNTTQDFLRPGHGDTASKASIFSDADATFDRFDNMRHLDAVSVAAYAPSEVSERSLRWSVANDMEFSPVAKLRPLSSVRTSAVQSGVFQEPIADDTGYLHGTDYSASGRASARASGWASPRASGWADIGQPQPKHDEEEDDHSDVTVDESDDGEQP